MTKITQGSFNPPRSVQNAERKEKTAKSENKRKDPSVNQVNRELETREKEMERVSRAQNRLKKLKNQLASQSERNIKNPQSPLDLTDISNQAESGLEKVKKNGINQYGKADSFTAKVICWGDNPEMTYKGQPIFFRPETMKPGCGYDDGHQWLDDKLIKNLKKIDHALEKTSQKLPVQPEETETLRGIIAESLEKNDLGRHQATLEVLSGLDEGINHKNFEKIEKRLEKNSQDLKINYIGIDSGGKYIQNTAPAADEASYRSSGVSALKALRGMLNNRE